MTPELVRFISNTRQTFRQLSTEQLYQLALSLRHELTDRQLDCVPEADALVLALLGEARVTRARIYSADCSDSERVYLDHGEPLLAPGRPASRPAEQS